MNRFGDWLRHPVFILCCFLCVIAAYRLSLVRTGHFFWGDEIRYLRASEAIDDVARGDFRSASARLFQSLGRPGFILISVIPTWLARAFGADATTPASPLVPYDAAAMFNVLVSLAVSAMVYLLARRWGVKSTYALLATVAYSLMAQSNVWIKHLVPYNESLLLFLLSLWLISRRQGIDIRRLGWIALAGCLSAMAFATYPGHYMFVVINFLCVVAPWRNDAAGAFPTSAVGWLRSSLPRLMMRRLVAFSFGAIAVVLVFEGLAQSAGTTWIGSSRQFAPTMGLFSEGYAFAWHYLCDSEGLVGVVLAFLFVAYVVRMVRLRELNLGTIAILAAIGCYLVHATLGVVFQKTVFYGRILLMYMPFVVIGAVMAIAEIRSIKLRRAATGALVVASCWSFVQFAIGYAKLTYPADFWYGAVAHSARNAAALSPDELYGSADGSPIGITDRPDSIFTMVADSMPEGSTAYIPLANHEDAQHTEVELIGVNIRWMFYIHERNERFAPPLTHELIAEAKHPLAFPPLQFEGFRPCERKRMQERQYTMRIYKRNGETDSKASEALADNSR